MDRLVMMAALLLGVEGQAGIKIVLLDLPLTRYVTCSPYNIACCIMTSCVCCID